MSNHSYVYVGAYVVLTVLFESKPMFRCGAKGWHETQPPGCPWKAGDAFCSSCGARDSALRVEDRPSVTPADVDNWHVEEQDESLLFLRADIWRGKAGPKGAYTISFGSNLHIERKEGYGTDPSVDLNAGGDHYMRADGDSIAHELAEFERLRGPTIQALAKHFDAEVEYRWGAITYYI